MHGSWPHPGWRNSLHAKIIIQGVPAQISRKTIKLGPRIQKRAVSHEQPLSQSPTCLCGKGLQYRITRTSNKVAECRWHCVLNSEGGLANSHKHNGSDAPSESSRPLRESSAKINLRSPSRLFLRCSGRQRCLSLSDGRTTTPVFDVRLMSCGSCESSTQQASRPTTRAVQSREITMRRPKAVGNTTTQHHLHNSQGGGPICLRKNHVPSNSDKLSTASYPATNHHLPNYQLPNYQLSNGPTVQLPATKSQAPTAHHQLPATSVQEPSTNCPPPTTSHQRPKTNDPVPTTTYIYQQPTTKLPTT